MNHIYRFLCKDSTQWGGVKHSRGGNVVLSISKERHGKICENQGFAPSFKLSQETREKL